MRPERIIIMTFSWKLIKIGAFLLTAFLEKGERLRQTIWFLVSCRDAAHGAFVLSFVRTRRRRASTHLSSFAFYLIVLRHRANLAVMEHLSHSRVSEIKSRAIIEFRRSTISNEREAQSESSRHMFLLSFNFPFYLRSQKSAFISFA